MNEYEFLKGVHSLCVLEPELAGSDAEDFRSCSATLASWIF